MPKRKKGTKKPPADFEKKKAKVGKVTTNANHTSTEFKSRSILVRSQKAASDPSATAEAKSERGLTLSELLIRVGHYTEQARKDALAGLRTLFARHPESLEHTATLMRLFEKIAPRMHDSASGVRKELLHLLGDVVTIVAPACLAPFFPLLLVHTASAMTNLTPSVRRDSLQLVDLWLDAIPTVVFPHAPQLLDHLLHIISARSTEAAKAGAADTRSSRTLVGAPVGGLATLEARVSVLRRVLQLLELGLRAKSAGSTATEGERQPIGRSNHWQCPPRRVVSVSTAMSVDGAGPAETATKESFLDDPRSCAKWVLEELMPVVTQCWVEHNPAGLALGDRPMAQLANLKVIVDLVHLVTTHLTQVTDHAAEADVDVWRHELGRMVHTTLMAHFPLGNGMESSDLAALSSVTMMNLRLAEATTLLAARTPSGGTRAVPWSSPVVSYVVELIGTSESGERLQWRAVRDNQELALLTVISTSQRIISMIPPDKALDLVRCIYGIYEDKAVCQPTSTQKMILVNFFAIFVDECGRCAQPGGGFARTPAFRPIISSFVQSLPRLLWELKATNLKSTNIILDILANIGRHTGRGSGGDVWREVPLARLDDMQAGLALLFHGQFGSRGVFGPFIRYPLEVQRKIINLLFFVDDISSTLLSAVLTCINLEQVPAPIVAHVIRVLHLRVGPTPDPSEAAQLFGFVATATAGYSAKMLKENSRRPLEEATNPVRQVLDGAFVSIVPLCTADEPSVVRVFVDRKVAVWSAAVEFATRLGWPRERTFRLVEQLVLRGTDSTSLDEATKRLPRDAVLGLVCLVPPPKMLQEQVECEEVIADSKDLTSFMISTIWLSSFWVYGHVVRAEPGESESVWAAAGESIAEVVNSLIAKAPLPSGIVTGLLRAAMTSAAELTATAATDAVAIARLFTTLITLKPDVWSEHRNLLFEVAAAVGATDTAAPRSVQRFSAEIALL